MLIRILLKMAIDLRYIVFLSLIITTVECCCPDGWYRFQGSCYFFETQQESWHDAVKYCEALHGHLVTLETDDEYKFITAELLKMNRGLTGFEFWTSGNDIAVEDIWVWNYTSERVSINYWGPGEPSHGTEDCLGLLHNNGQVFMNDAPCDFKTGLVCEIDDNGGEFVG